MYELRMYVEHLFEGRVLSTDMIELKEEIYGNLVARYEDLVEQGLDAVQALEQAKASVTSIDEVLEGEACKRCEDSPAVKRDTAHAVGDETAVVGGERPQGGPKAPGELDSENEKKSTGQILIEEEPGRKKWATWKIVLVVMAAAAVVACIALVACGAVAFKMIDSTNEHSIKLTDDEGNGILVEDGEVTLHRGEDGVTVDADGTIRYDGEPADRLVQDVVDSTSADVSSYVNTSLSHASILEDGLLRTLPLGGYVADVTVSEASGFLGFTYQGVPDTYDGDSVDLALVYNVTALMTAIPELKEVHVTVSENEGLTWKTATPD